jgi:hypothetical protein
MSGETSSSKHTTNHQYAAHDVAFPGSLTGHGQTAQHFHRDRVAEHNAEQILAQANVGPAAVAEADKPQARTRRKTTRKAARQ